MRGDNLFAHKSKPIAKSASQSYVTKKREIFLSFELRDIREKYESFVHPRDRNANKHNQGMAIDAGFATINMVKSWDRICWPHHGPAYGGERRVPKRVEGRLVEKVNLLVELRRADLRR